jgi:hypothetical protein
VGAFILFYRRPSLRHHATTSGTEAGKNKIDGPLLYSLYPHIVPVFFGLFYLFLAFLSKGSSKTTLTFYKAHSHKNQQKKSISAFYRFFVFIAFGAFFSEGGSNFTKSMSK